MKFRIRIFVFLLFVGCSPASPSSQTAELNGIRFSDYAGFEKNWKLITVRYRTDTSEERFVWANPKAATVLASGGTEYPDGAVFAKVGMMTKEDPLFANSKVPSGAQRYQFMVRDQKKYAATHGWGYALFDGSQAPSANFNAEIPACFACHQLASSRGEVFSQILTIGAAWPKASVIPQASDLDLGRLKFASAEPSALPSILQKIIPKSKLVRLVQGELPKHVFKGTLDEIRPSLVNEAAKQAMPAGLVSTDKLQFEMVFPDSSVPSCGNEIGYQSVFSIVIPGRGGAPMNVVAWQSVCP
jgi:hypothetical protein